MNNFYISVQHTNNLFKKDYIYARTLFNPILFQNKIGPHGGNSTSKSLNLSLIKSFSEAIERRSLMLPTVQADKRYKAYDMVTGKSKFLPGNILGYDYFTDSTGTATHINSFKAIEHAVGELIEKNALLKIWYSFDAKNISKIGWNPPAQYKEKTVFILNNFFFPYYVVLAAYKDADNFWHCGLGFSSNNVNTAKKAAFEEMRLIWFQNEIDKVNPNSPVKFNKDILVYWRWSQSQIDHMDKLISRASKCVHLNLNSQKISNIDVLGRLLSQKIQHLYITFIPDSLFNGPFSTIRCFSNELVSCVAKKDVLLELLNRKSISFINLTNIKNNVDCPII